MRPLQCCIGAAQRDWQRYREAVTFSSLIFTTHQSTSASVSPSLSSLCAPPADKTARTLVSVGARVLKSARCEVCLLHVTPAVEVSCRSVGTDRLTYGSYPAEPSLLICGCLSLSLPAVLSSSLHRSLVLPMSYLTSSHTASSSLQCQSSLWDSPTPQPPSALCRSSRPCSIYSKGVNTWWSCFLLTQVEGKSG